MIMVSSINIYLLIFISFTTYFIVSWVYKRLGIFNLQKGLLVTNGLRLLNLKHLLGIVLFGVLFYIVKLDLRYLIENIEIPRLPVLILFFALLFLCAYVSYLSLKNGKFENESLSNCDISDAYIYFLIRFSFLLCYEFFFRGVLLFVFLEFNSLFLAIIYSTILYVIIHLFDSKKELIGAVPFGIVLCLFTYITNSIWYAFLIHLCLSAVYEISLFYNLTLKTSRS